MFLFPPPISSFDSLPWGFLHLFVPVCVQPAGGTKERPCERVPYGCAGSQPPLCWALCSPQQPEQLEARGSKARKALFLHPPSLCFRDLARKDRNGASDPFVRVRYHGKTQESSVSLRSKTSSCKRVVLSSPMAAGPPLPPPFASREAGTWSAEGPIHVTVSVVEAALDWVRRAQQSHSCPLAALLEEQGSRHTIPYPGCCLLRPVVIPGGRWKSVPLWGLTLRLCMAQ